MLLYSIKLYFIGKVQIINFDTKVGDMFVILPLRFMLFQLMCISVIYFNKSNSYKYLIKQKMFDLYMLYVGIHAVTH